MKCQKRTYIQPELVLRMKFSFFRAFIVGSWHNVVIEMLIVWVMFTVAGSFYSFSIWSIRPL